MTTNGGGAFGSAAARRSMVPLAPRKQGAATPTEPEPKATTAAAVAEPPAPAPEPKVQRTAERPAKTSASKTSKTAKGSESARKVVNVQIPIAVWTPWDQLVTESGLRFRGDLINAALRALLELPDTELGVEILAQTTGADGAVKALSARVDVDLYAQLTARVKQGLGLPINAAMATALRRQHEAGADALVSSVLAERRPS